MSISDSKPVPPLNSPPSRPLRAPREVSTTPTNWVQAESPAPRASGGANPGVTPRAIKADTPEPARSAPEKAQMREEAQAIVAATDNCLDKVMDALLKKDFEGASEASKGVAKALEPIVDRQAKKAEEILRNRAEVLRNETEVLMKEERVLQHEWMVLSEVAKVARKEATLFGKFANASNKAEHPVIVEKAEKKAGQAEKAAGKAEKTARAALDQALFMRKEGPGAEKAPYLSELTADACGERLHYLVPKLKDDQLASLNKNLDAFFEQETSEESDGSPMAAPEGLVLPQLQFSIKAELLFRLMPKSSNAEGVSKLTKEDRIVQVDKNDAESIGKMTKDGLLGLRDLTSTLNAMARPGAPKADMLPGTRLEWLRLMKIDQLVESRLNPILMTESANRRVADAKNRLEGNDRGALLRLKTSIDFLVKTGPRPTDVSLLQLQKDVTARIKVVEKTKTDALVTPEMLKGPSGTFKARALTAAQLMPLMKKLLETDPLTLDLEFVKEEVEAALNKQKSDASADFQEAFNAALTAAGTDQSTVNLLNLLVAAEKSLASFKASNWDSSGAGLPDWIGEAVRAPKPAAKGDGRGLPGKESVGSRLASKILAPKQAAVSPYRDEKRMAALRDDMVRGDGRVIRDLLAAHSPSKAVFARLDLLRETLDVLLDGKSPALVSSAPNTAKLTPAGLSALKGKLNLTIENGQLAVFMAVAKPTAQGAPKPQSQKT